MSNPQQDSNLSDKLEQLESIISNLTVQELKIISEKLDNPLLKKLCLLYFLS